MISNISLENTYLYMSVSGTHYSSIFEGDEYIDNGNITTLRFISIFEGIENLEIHIKFNNLFSSKWPSENNSQFSHWLLYNHIRQSNLHVTGLCHRSGLGFIISAAFLKPLWNVSYYTYNNYNEFLFLQNVI